MKKTTTAKGYAINTAVLAVVFIAFELIQSAVGKSGGFKLILAPSLWQCCYLILLAASLNLVLGFLGQLSLGHCGFMAIGAYTAALVSLAFERAGVYTAKSGAAFVLVLFACILLAGVLSAAVGLLVGIPALRLKGDYLAIITLGFGMLRRLLGTGTIGVNSYHHQGIREPAPSLRVEARAPDGLVEAVTCPTRRFLLGVQWHPEFSYRTESSSAAIFRAFVESCTRFRNA